MKRRSALLLWLPLLVTLFLPSRADAWGGFLSKAAADGSAGHVVVDGAHTILYQADGTTTAHIQVQVREVNGELIWIVPLPAAPKELEVEDGALHTLARRGYDPDIVLLHDNFCGHNEISCIYPDEFCSSFSPTHPKPNKHKANNNPLFLVPAALLPPSPLTSLNVETLLMGELPSRLDMLEAEGFVISAELRAELAGWDVGTGWVLARFAPQSRGEVSLRASWPGGPPAIPLALSAPVAAAAYTLQTLVYGAEPNATYAGLSEATGLWSEEGIDAGSADEKAQPNVDVLLVRRLLQDTPGFVLEYAGPSTGMWQIEASSMCCELEGDACGLANDQLCQCPFQSVDQADCRAEVYDFAAAAKQLGAIEAAQPATTQLMTVLSLSEREEELRLSQLEEPRYNTGKRHYNGIYFNLEECSRRALDAETFAALEVDQRCATTWCGEGSCAVLEDGSTGCACAPGFAVQTFAAPLTGRLSLLCAPSDAPGCPEGEGATLDGAGEVRCVPIQTLSSDAGARTIRSALKSLVFCPRELPVCASKEELILVPWQPMLLPEGCPPQPEPSNPVYRPEDAEAYCAVPESGEGPHPTDPKAVEPPKKEDDEGGCSTPPRRWSGAGLALALLGAALWRR